jgi:hypothetical protein
MTIPLKWLATYFLIGAVCIPVQASAAAGVCRNDVNGSCGTAKDPCQPQEDAVSQLQDQLFKAQHQLNTVNSAQAEKQLNYLKKVVSDDQAALKKPRLAAITIQTLKEEISKDEKLIAEQESAIKQAKSDFAHIYFQLQKAKKALKDCKDRNGNKSVG